MSNARHSLLLGLLLFLAACQAPVRLREISDTTWFERENRNALEARDPSERTVQFLRRADLSARFFREPREVLQDLHGRLLERRERDLALHLAELCYLRARVGSLDAAERARLNLSTVRYAYAYLLDPSLTPAASPYDPGFRWACDFYNRALARVLTYVREHPDLERVDGVLTLPALVGSLRISLGAHPGAWDMKGFTEVLIAFNYDVTGLPGRARSYGVGVPLVLAKPVTADEMGFRPEIVTKLAQSRALDEIELKQTYAATAFLRIPSSILEDDPATEAWFELHDSMNATGFEVAGQEVPLEADLTSPLAHALGAMRAPSGINAMFNPGESVDVTGLVLLQPFDEDKIPLVFVHGLMSSPMTWMHLFNDLVSDPVLRQRYQFLFFRYPTGNPIFLSAAILRDTLKEYRQSVDPEGSNRNFDQMVVVGHSMGGLLTRLQILDGGDDLWDRFSEEPIDSLDLPEDQLELVKTVVYFQRNPDIQRVVFMATPHRGSDLATGFVGWLGRSLISLPAKVAGLTGELIDQVGGFAKARLGREVTEDSATGVGGLAPDSFLSTEVSQIPLPPEVKVHSIIGNEDEAGVPGGSDGVVAYESSHLDGVESEWIVESGHNVQESPAALVELRRILHLHLAEVDARRQAVTGSNESEEEQP